MIEAECPKCGSAEIEGERQVEERGGVFGLAYKDGQLQAEVDWSDRQPFGSVSYRCFDCDHTIWTLRELLPKKDGA